MERPLEAVVYHETVHASEKDLIIQTEQVIDLEVVVIAVAVQAQNGGIPVITVQVLVRPEPDLFLGILRDGADGQGLGTAYDFGYAGDDTAPGGDG